VRQLCLSASLVPQSFIDEMRNPATLEPRGMVTDAPPVAVASMPADKKEVLMARLRQAISDEEECSVSDSDLFVVRS
jgi:SWI/SNF-related matrix-associated actin-dependent regulator of chromatin subfamily A3